jgi:hypothetical protein
VLWAVVLAGGVVALVVGVLGTTPTLVQTLGSITVAVAYAWALAVRTGGRPVVFGILAVLIGAAVVTTDSDAIRSGAAVLTCSLGAVLGVMATVPAVRVVEAVREVLIAFVVAAVGACAAIGFRPLIDLARFQYTTLALSLVITFVLVHRLGAGLHGLGRRGLVVVLGGGVLLALGIAYAELLRVYGTPGLVGQLIDLADWSDRHLGGYPRPMQALLGIPMLVWGTHLRARRRQGWWACAFGVVGLAPIAHVLAAPAFTATEALLTEAYTVVAGLVVGALVIRVDLLLSGSGGRRASRSEEARAVRPEPGRTRPLL